MHVEVEFEPKRFEPWMPPVTSPAASSFGIGLPNTSITSVFALIRKPLTDESTCTNQPGATSGVSFAAFVPAIRPNTTQSTVAFPPRRLSP